MSKLNRSKRREIRGRVNHELAEVVRKTDLAFIGGNLNEQEMAYAQQVRDDIANMLAATADRAKDRAAEDESQD